MKGKEKKDILSVLENRLSSFSKGQRIIARFIMENYDKAAFMTASRLGSEVGVSESTVVRFAAELGYRGYPGMKKALQEVVRTRLTSVERMKRAETAMDTRDVLRNVLRADIHNLQATLDEIDQPSFDHAVELIRNAKNVYIVGMRTSTTLARFLWLYLNVLRENVFVIQDTAAAEVYEQLMRVKDGDLVIGVCFPRYSNRTVNVMGFARERGASTLGITDSVTSPLNESSTVCLYAKSEMVSFLDSLVAPMGLINALIVAVGAQDRDQTVQTFRELEQIWKEYGVYQIDEDWCGCHRRRRRRYDVRIHRCLRRKQRSSAGAKSSTGTKGAHHG